MIIKAKILTFFILLTQIFTISCGLAPLFDSSNDDPESVEVQTIKLPNITGPNAFYKSADACDTKAVMNMINKGNIDLESKDLFDNTGFIKAADNGCTETVMAMIESGKINIEAKNDSNRTAIQEAALSRETETVYAMADSGKVEITSNKSVLFHLRKHDKSKHSTSIFKSFRDINKMHPRSLITLKSINSEFMDAIATVYKVKTKDAQLSVQLNELQKFYKNYEPETEFQFRLKKLGLLFMLSSDESNLFDKLISTEAYRIYSALIVEHLSGQKYPYDKVEDIYKSFYHEVLESNTITDNERDSIISRVINYGFGANFDKGINAFIEFDSIYKVSLRFKSSIIGLSIEEEKKHENKKYEEKKHEDKDELSI